MRFSNGTNLKGRLTQVLWVANAVFSVLLALAGGLMSSAAISDSALLSAMTARLGTVLVATGLALAIFSLWRAFSIARSVALR